MPLEKFPQVSQDKLSDLTKVAQAVKNKDDVLKDKRSVQTWCKLLGDLQVQDLKNYILLLAKLGAFSKSKDYEKKIAELNPSTPEVIKDAATLAFTRLYGSIVLLQKSLLVAEITGTEPSKLEKWPMRLYEYVKSNKKIPITIYRKKVIAKINETYPSSTHNPLKEEDFVAIIYFLVIKNYLDIYLEENKETRSLFHKQYGAP